MTNAQTEARASLWVPAKPEHAKLGWTYDFEQTERISRAAYDSTGYEATMEVVEFVMAEADRRHATALAAKDAELAAKHEAYCIAHDQAMENGQALQRAEAQLAEANKMLEPFSRFAGPLFERNYNATDSLTSIAAADGGYVVLTAGDFFAARRARETQGGE